MVDSVERLPIAGRQLGLRIPNAFLWGSWSYFDLSNPVAAGNYIGGGESSYFFGMVSTEAPVLRTVWVHLDSGWVSMDGYAPLLP
jgi:hypothetical protein